MKIQIAVVVSEDGNVRCCGPNDFDEGMHRDSMAAARCWTAECGEIIVSSHWIEAEIPEPIKTPIAGTVTELM